MGMALRWLGALAVMAVVAVISVNLALDQLRGAVELGDASDDPGLPTAAPATDPLVGPVQDGSATPTADFAVLGGEVAGSEAELLVFEGAGEAAMVLTFPLITGDPACLQEALLEITLLEATPATLGGFPAGFDPADLSDSDEVSGALGRTDEPMALAETDGSPGRLRWDVTDLYRQWVAGTPFPGGGEAVAAGTPLTIVVQAIEETSRRHRMVLAATEVGAEGAPSLRWTGLASCGTGVAPGAGSTTATPQPPAGTTDPAATAPEV